MDPPGGAGDPPPNGTADIHEMDQSQPTLNAKKPKKQLEYCATDFGPYQVMIESLNVFSESDITNSQKTAEITNNKKGNLHIGRLNHLSIAKKILDMKLENVLKFEKKGRNRLCISFKTWQSANAFLKNDELARQGYEMFIPANLVSCKGIIRNVDKSFTDDELLKYSEVQNSSHKIRIINIKRLNRRTDEVGVDGAAIYAPTPTVLFTFSGKILPKFVNICMLPMPVVPYILPVIQCKRCFLYGHTKKNCNSKEKCPTCSKPMEGHSAEPCGVSCMHCSSELHLSTDKQCPEYERQKLIREVMSLDNLSFFDANLRVPKKSNITMYITKEGEFPSLRNGEEVDNTIPVHQRRNFTNSVPTFSHVVKKRRPSPVSPGYDRNVHNSCLNNPNGRIAPECPSVHVSAQMAPQWPSTSVTAEVVAKDSVSALVSIFETLTVPQRELVLKRLNNLAVATDVEGPNEPNSPEEYY